MEHTTIEVVSIQETSNEASDKNIHELQELQLALIGGGIGDPVAG